MTPDLASYTTGVNENWRFLTHSAKTWTAVDHTTKKEPFRYTPLYGIEAKMESTDYWYALELDIKAAAKYKAVFKSAYTGGSYGRLDFYVFPAAGVTDAADVEAAINAKLVSDNYIGQADCYTSGGGEITVDLANDVVIQTAGKYVMVVKAAGRNASAKNDYTYLTGMTLEYVDDAETDEAVEYTYSLRTMVWDGSGNGFDNFDGGNWVLHSRSSGTSLLDSATWPAPQFQGLSADGDYLIFELKNIKPGKYDASIMAMRTSASVAADFYIIPKCDDSMIELSCTEDFLIGNHDNYAATTEATTSEFKFANAAQVPVEGSSYLVIKRTSAVGAAQNRLQICDLKLTRIGDAEVEAPKPKPIEYTYPLRTMVWDGSGNGFDNFDGGNWALHSRSSGTSLLDSATWPAPQFQGLSADGDYLIFELKNIKPGKYDASIMAMRTSASVAADFYIIPKCDDSMIELSCTEDFLIGNHDNYVI